jgi:hypothetical protein
VAQWTQSAYPKIAAQAKAADGTVLFLACSSTRPACCIIDGHPAHRAKAVTEFVASTDGALRLFGLPAYSPQLNPDE